MKGRDESSPATTIVLQSGSSPPGLTLRVIEGAIVTSRSLPSSGRLVIGRAHDADIQVDSASLSRRHAALHLGREMRIEDLRSANGTRVGGRRLPPGGSAEVKLGETIELGSVLVVVQQDDRAAVTTAPAAAESTLPAVVGELPAAVERIAASAISVLLFGETGVGKEVMAERIHARSPRAKGPLIRLNCAAFSEHLLESELFGYEKGAFTGAGQAKEGLFEVASGGTVFLDEVGELPLGLQAKLLRVLEQREVLRVGALRPRAIDVRFVSATNRDLEADAASGRFRRDLLFRLNGYALTIPPLRERPHEIEPLARAFVDDAARRAGLPRPPRLSTNALAVLTAYPWPGNVRELRNVIERTVVLCDGDVVQAEHIALESARPHPHTLPPPPISTPSQPPASLRAEIDEIERQRIIDALARCGGNQTMTAKELGISRGTLLARLDAYGILRPRKRS